MECSRGEPRVLPARTEAFNPRERASKLFKIPICVIAFGFAECGFGWWLW